MRRAEEAGLAVMVLLGRSQWVISDRAGASSKPGRVGYALNAEVNS
jgi:hypothetical protein